MMAKGDRCTVVRIILLIVCWWAAVVSSQEEECGFNPALESIEMVHEGATTRRKDDRLLAKGDRQYAGLRCQLSHTGKKRERRRQRADHSSQILQEWRGPTDKCESSCIG
jgi:hypothetical protein